MEEERYLKRQRIYRTVMLIAITICLTSILTAMYISNKYNLTKEGTSNLSLSSIINSSDQSSDLTKSITNIQNLIKKYYLNEIDEQKAIDGAIAGYVNSLGDPYTEYIPAEEMKEYTEQLMGNYVGIGIYMIKNTEKNAIEVQMPIKESPAEKAGILPGDIILSVDGKEYTGDEMTTAANNIKGEAGTKVKLEILRDKEKITFELERQKINTNPVIAEKLENDTGYIEVSSFDEGTADDFKSKFEGLKGQGIKSLIIDIRNNGGGLVDEALQIADYIVPKNKELLITVDKDGKEEIEKSKADVLIDMPVIMLVNEYSASSSEILAGALKDLKEATIVGTTTYGKGVIQQLLSLKDGSGLKITIEEYYTPNRTKIHKVGIEPDVKVELPDTIKNPLIVKKEEDTQLQKAIEMLQNKEAQ